MLRLLIAFSLAQGFSSLSIYENPMESWFMQRFPGPIRIVADAGFLGWGLSIPGDVEAPVQGPAFGTPV